MDNEFEQIVPWNGAQDTGRDVRMKWQRNFERIKSSFEEISEKLKGISLEELQKMFLRKDAPDSTKFLLTLFKGVVIGKDGFASGLTGFGAKIDEYGNGEMESLFLRRFLEVPELRYNRVSVTMGDTWNAPGAGILESVTVDTDSSGNPLMTGTGVLKLEDGEFGAVSVGDICMGIFHSENSEENATENTDDSRGNRTFAGFYTTYFTVTEVSDDTKTFRYQLRPVSDRWRLTKHPCEAMHFVAYGNFTNTDRQTSTYTTRDYTRRLWKQNTWEISAANIAMQSGNLMNLNVHGMQMTGYSMYLNSVYFSGTILQTKPDGTPIRTANDRGAWPPEDNHADFYDRFSYDGSLWLCVNEDGTSTTPAEGNPDWLKQVDKGETGAKGEDGKSVRYLGRWYTGLLVPYLGIVRMGTASYMCIAENGTTNPPLWTVTDKNGNRLQQTQDGGKTYGYILTGEMNTAEYALVAEDGLNGTDGIQGPKGEDGRTTYFHIKYSANPDGNPMGETPNIYIGTYVDYTEADSDDYTKYTWSRFQGMQGEKGIPGTNGANGVTYYLHIKYSDDGGATFTANNGETPGKFMGQLVDTNEMDSSTPSAYKWSQIRGEDGEDGASPQMLGNWKTGLFVPYLGIVRMGGASWSCKVAGGTTNPPLWTVTDKNGNRLLQTQDGGKTYGYILTGEKNTGEYELVAEDGQKGEDGAPGKDGEQGLQGCILRYAEWTIGTEYRNDEALTSGTRYLDVALVKDANTATGWRAYKCKQTHTASTANAPGNTTCWEEFGVNTTSLFTSLIIAKNALIEFMSGNQLLIKKDDGTITIGLTGNYGGKAYIWAGGTNPGNARFTVDETGKVVAVDGEFSGIISGTLQSLRTSGGEILLSNEQAWFNGVDIYNQGTKDGRPLRFYASEIWCRGAFGARQRLTVRIAGNQATYYLNGTDRTGTLRTLASSTTAEGSTYYIVPCYGESGTGFEGMPVDTLVFNNTSRYNYLLNMADTQRVTVINANDNVAQNTYLLRNGKMNLLDGGKSMILQQIPAGWMTPATAANALGRGIICIAQNDDDWR